jgi:hypothetical protein
VRIINKEFFQNQSYESEIIKKISKKDFYDTLRKKGFNPEILLSIKKFTFSITEKFNKSLRKTHKLMNMNMFDMILILDEDLINMDTLINVLDDRNKQIIRNECIKTFHIDDSDTILFDILA